MRLVDPASLPAPVTHRAQRAAAAAGRPVHLIDMTTDLAVPAFCAYTSPHGDHAVHGFGASLSAEHAAGRALDELAQVTAGSPPPRDRTPQARYPRLLAAGRADVDPHLATAERVRFTPPTAPHHPRGPSRRPGYRAGRARPARLRTHPAHRAQRGVHGRGVRPGSGQVLRHHRWKRRHAGPRGPGPDPQGRHPLTRPPAKPRAAPSHAWSLARSRAAWPALVGRRLDTFQLVGIQDNLRHTAGRHRTRDAPGQGRPKEEQPRSGRYWVTVLRDAGPVRVRRHPARRPGPGRMG
ncbi:hypothetical protein CK485_07085 [Streptomyces sp. ICBB 8177]|nr:hypothetical protein CK485_07085 [Streptomyces sp. ICBB 8177]